MEKGSRRESCSLIESTKPLRATNFRSENESGYTVQICEAGSNGNSENALAGQFDDAGGNTHGFVLRNRVYTTIDKPGSILSFVNGINDQGHLVGTYLDAAGVHAYFFSQAAQFVSLDPPGAVRSQGGNLNEIDQAVGSYRTPDNKRHGYIWSRGSFSSFNVPNDHPVLGTIPFGINNRGDIVGD